MKMKLFTIAISFLVMMSGFLIVVSGEDTSFNVSVEEGESEPIEIHDWHDLDKVRDDLDSDYILMNDLDEDTDGYDELVDTEKGWEPIGDRDWPYVGVFDGNGYEINDLYINRPGDEYVGLFGYIREGTVTDVSLFDAYVRGGSNVGSLIGENADSTVECSSATGDVSGYSNVGGLVGYLRGHERGTIKNSYATITVTGNENVGGLVGYLSNNAVVEYSYAICDVSGNRSVGGLVGESIGLVRNSYFVGEITGESYLGGLIGKESTYPGIDPVVSVVRNSFWDRTISGITRGSGTGLMTEEMTGLSAKENMTGFDFENTWDVYDDGTYVSYPYLIDNAQEPAPGLQHVDDIDYFLPVDPDTRSQPYHIENWTHLNKTRIRPGASYRLSTHLDQYMDGYEEVASKIANDGDGFQPIGDSENRFTGVFDGQGFEIRDLYINRSDENFVGLFGRSEGDIKNLGVVDANVSGKGRVGALVGWQGNGAKVVNCYATGEVIGPNNYIISEHVGGLIGVNGNGASVSYSYTACNVSGVDNIGGLVGYQQIDAALSNSYAIGKVTGEIVVGGLIGKNLEGTIKNSFATGNVVGEMKVGGLIGVNNIASLSDSYATGDVNGKEYVGGLVGENNYAVVEYSYSRGNVDGEEYVGGLVGRNWAGGEVENSFWDIDTSGLEESGGGTGLTTDEMTGENAPNNMQGFDFDDTWETVIEDDEDTTNDGYPILQGLDREEQLRAQGVYQEEEDENGIPGFTMLLMVLSVVVALIVYCKKKW